MRVAFPLGGTDWGRSGIGTYVRAALPYMARHLAERGESLFAVGTASELDAYADGLAGVEQLTLPPALNEPGLSAAWYLADAAHYCARQGADVVFFPAVQRRFSVYRPVPTVGVIHDLGQLRVTDKYDPLRMFYFKRVILPLVTHATRLVAISQATRADMVRFMGVSEQAVTVVSLGVDVERFAPRPSDAPEVQAARRATGLPEKYLLYAARLEHPAKNHLRLLQAFAQSTLRDSHVLALAGGDWGGRELLVAEIARLGLGERVRLLGYVADEVLPGLMAGADAVIMVGLTEGFGLPALEALAAGRPLCAADAGALPEVVGPHAALCDPLSVPSIARALETAARDEAFRARIANEGPRYAAERGWARTAEGLLAVCRSAAAEGPRR